MSPDSCCFTAVNHICLEICELSTITNHQCLRGCSCASILMKKSPFLWFVHWQVTTSTVLNPWVMSGMGSTMVLQQVL